MTRRRNESDPTERPQVDPATGIHLLEEQLQKGHELLQSRPLTDDSYGQWELVTRNYLEKAFGRLLIERRQRDECGKVRGFPDERR